MAKDIPPSTWENGYQAPSTISPWLWPPPGNDIEEDPDAYICLPSKDLVTSSHHNSKGINIIRTWPSMYDGTDSPHGLPPWWKPASEVDVLICGGEKNIDSYRNERALLTWKCHSRPKWASGCPESCEAKCFVPHHW